MGKRKSIEIVPDAKFSDDNPYSATMAGEGDWIDAWVRITPPCFLNDSALKFMCNSAEGPGEVKVRFDHVAITKNSTVIGLFEHITDPSKADASPDERVKSYTTVVKSILELLGATENPKLFKKYKG